MHDEITEQTDITEELKINLIAEENNKHKI